MIFPRPERLDLEVSEFLKRLGKTVLNWRWAICDLEIGLCPDTPERIAKLVQKGSSRLVWVTGPELAELAGYIAVANWGVFLAFEDSADPVTFVKAPQGEGYSGPIQHPEALLEIRAVDGGYLEVAYGENFIGE